MTKRIVILGAGESGTGAAILAKQKGFEVFLSDKGKIAPKYLDELKTKEIAFEQEKHTEKLILNADEVIKSPGIPDKAPLIQALINQKTPVISEIEFASRFTDATKICITGSNGKTTTTGLTYHLFNKAGCNVGLGGNIGKSFARLVAEHQFDYYVLELSSFQLDGMFDFRAETAILTNVTPDHLDRYDYNFQNYIDSKFRILQNMTKDNHFIYCADDEVTMNEISKRNMRAKMYPFSLRKLDTEGGWLNGEEIIININNKPITMSIQSLALQGRHNLYNTMAAGIAARIYDLKKDSIRESMSDFQNAEHRMEYVANVYGIEFINDSKATNVNSAWWALESMNKPVIWIVGGVDKGNDYSMLYSVIKEKVKAIICLGKDNEKLHTAFGDKVKTMVNASSAMEAVTHAYQLGQKGDVVLLSPACASFDLFTDYEDRGRQFKKAVRSL